MVGDIVRTIAVGQVGGSLMMAYKAAQVMAVHGWRWALYCASRWVWYGAFGLAVWSMFSLTRFGALVALVLLFGLPALRAVLFEGAFQSMRRTGGR